MNDRSSVSRTMRRWTRTRLSRIEQALVSALRRRKKNGVLLSGSRTSMWISSCVAPGRIRGTPSLRAAAITLRRALSEALPRSFKTRSTVEARLQSQQTLPTASDVVLPPSTSLHFRIPYPLTINRQKAECETLPSRLNSTSPRIPKPAVRALSKQLRTWSSNKGGN